MSRYSDEFKQMVVTDYLEGDLGYKLLARKYNIPSSTPIKRWVQSYKAFGVEGIRNKRSRKDYSFQFKFNVLHFMKQTGASYQRTAIEFNMNQPSLIAKWKTNFLNEGIEGLKGKTKGCPPMSKKVSNQKVTSREKQLERENELLRLEVAYLKKLEAFQENPDAYLEKHKQQWHSNSKKKDSN